MNSKKSKLFEAKANGDPMILFLEEVGFTFDLINQKIHVPPPSVISQKYNEHMDSLVRSGHVTKYETLRIARAFLRPEEPGSTKGTLINIKIGETIPEDVVPVEYLLNDQAWVQMLSDGFVTFGEAADVNSAKGLRVDNSILPMTHAEHDLGHMKSFWQFPKYMAEVRRGAYRLQKYAEIGPDGNYNDVIRTRLFYTTEALILPKKGSLKELEQVLSMPPHPANRDYYTVNEVTEHLKGLSSKEYELLQSNLKSRIPHLIDRIGGAVGDLGTSRIDGGNIGFDGQTLDSLYDNAMITHGDGFRDIRSLAELQVGMVELAKISPEEFAKQALNIRIDKTTDFYKVMCLTGIFNSTFVRADGSALIKAFCI